MKETRRDPSIELYRTFLMFGICMLHAIGQGGHVRRGVWDVLNVCLSGFVFISGYYGIRFRWGKIGSLLGIAIFCAVPIGILKAFVFGWNGNVAWQFLVGLHSLKSCWFLWAYLVLMVFAPLVEPLIGQSGTWKNAIPFLLAVFAWSYAARVPVLKDCIPVNLSLAGSGMHFFAIYLAARFIAASGIESMLRTRHLVFGAIISGVFCWIGFYHINSPFAFVLAASSFLLFKRMSIPRHIGSVLALLSPSLFSVYLIHTSDAGFRCIENLERILLDGRNWPYWPTMLLVAGTVFAVPVLADLPRRLILRLVRYLAGR